MYSDIMRKFEAYNKGGRPVRFPALVTFLEKILHTGGFFVTLITSKAMESVVHIRHFATISIISNCRKGG